MLLKSKLTGKEEKCDVIIVNMTSSKKITPNAVGIPDFQFQANPIIELTVVVVESICYELGEELWWKAWFV